MLQQNPDKKILVIAADIARYGLETTGESSQGGGAIALLLSANPGILALAPESGFYTQDVLDFWRPYYREEALVDGKYSCDVYLQVLLDVWAQYSELSQKKYQDFARFCYHTPVPRLVEKAHKWLAKRNNVTIDSEQELQAAMAHCLHYNRNIGNTYTASLYVSLLSLLDNDPQDLTDKLIGFYSYGSGCMGEFFAGKVKAGYRQKLDTAWNQNLINHRTELTYDQYHHFYTFPYPTQGENCEMPLHQTGEFRLTKINQHKRTYEGVDAEIEQLTQLTMPAKTYKHTVEPKMLTVRTPGKMILSGEHSVVYGRPALAMAINRYTETTISGHHQTAPTKNILFNLLNFRYHQEQSLPALQRLKKNIQEKYQKFLQGQYGIRDVLKEPFELMQFAVTHLIDNHKVQLPQGIEIKTESTIPMGCGLGSSAAAIVSAMMAVTHFSKLEIDIESCYQLAWEAENMQHGHSSGVDVYLVLHGGCIRFQKGGEKEIRPIPRRSFFLVNTGRPHVLNGRSGKFCSQILERRYALLDEFAEVTDRIDQALQRDDEKILIESIRRNHLLLDRIGVVPNRVKQFITEIEKRNGAAKICGAGAVRGDAAGIMLIVSSEDIADLAQKYQYELMSIQGELKGSHIL